MPPLVSAIVLNYRSGRLSVRCVRALLKQTIADRCEILVIDNHSEDDSIGILRASLKSVPHVRMLETPENSGYARGNSVAIRQATGKYLLIINPDNELAPESLEKMVQAMEEDDSIGILAPKLVHEDGTVRDSSRAFPHLLDVIAKRTALQRLLPGRVARYLRHGSHAQEPQDVDWVVGACILIRTDLYASLGGFDERFFLFFEDIDLCRRIRETGKRVVYFPSAVATDRKTRLSEGGIASLVFKRAGRHHIASAVKYFWKWRT